MPAPIALQLFTLREAAAEDYEGTVRKVADIGYAGVEPAGFPGTTPEAAARLFADLGLEVCSAHLPMPVGEKQQESLETAEAERAEPPPSSYRFPSRGHASLRHSRRWDLTRNPHLLYPARLGGTDLYRSVLALRFRSLRQGR